MVSRKKYDSLLSAKRSCDRRNRGLVEQVASLESTVDGKVKQIGVLDGKLKGMKEEYNNLKYDMSASNAQKSSEIDQLSEKLNNTIKDKKSIKAQTAELKNDLAWLRKLKELNRTKIDSLQTLTYVLNQKVAILQEENLEKTNGVSVLKVEIEQLKEKLDIANTRLKRAQTLNEKLQKDLVAQSKKAKASATKKVVEKQNNIDSISTERTK